MLATAPAAGAGLALVSGTGPVVGRLGITILPVALFLIALVVLDSYKLVALRSVLGAILAGMLAAIASYFVAAHLSGVLIRPWTYSRLVGPAVEEVCKALCVGWWIGARRTGFFVDAAILGFAVGAGFAITENIYYLRALPELDAPLWIVRGFGTAVMHGGATALCAIVAQTRIERRGAQRGLFLLPGLALAIAVHALFNQFMLPPALSAIAVLILLPLILTAVYRRSERSLQNWLGVGLDSDAALLAMINDGEILQTRVGSYLLALKERFPGPAVADMLCLLRLHLELSIRAKGLLLMREAGFTIPEPGPDVRERFAELRFLERSVGKTGLLAAMPILRWSRRDLWQMTILGRD